MAGLKSFIIGLCVGGVSSLIAMQIHVVNTNDGLIVLPRSNRPAISSTYVDVRKWSISMWRQHPQVAQAALKSGRVDLLGEGALNSIFPKQAETGTDHTPASKLTTDKAKLAMEALVPIKFSSPNGETLIAKPNVPAPATIDEVLPEIFTQKDQSSQNSSTPKKSAITKSNEIFPEGFQLDESILKGLPKLQKPIPIRDEIASEEVINDETREQKKSDLFTDVLKALIPQVKEQASNIPPQHSAAHPAYRIQAPQPNSQPVLPPDHQIMRRNHNEPSIPIVRPF